MVALHGSHIFNSFIHMLLPLQAHAHGKFYLSAANMIKHHADMAQVM